MVEQVVADIAGWRQLARLRALIAAGSGRSHHFGNAFGALFGLAFRPVDPAQTCPAIELRELVEECHGVGIGGQG